MTLCRAKSQTARPGFHWVCWAAVYRAFHSQFKATLLNELENKLGPFCEEAFYQENPSTLELFHYYYSFSLFIASKRYCTLQQHKEKSLSRSLRCPGGLFSERNERVSAVRFPKPFLTLFMTKICEFPFPIYGLTKHSALYLWPLCLAQLL